MSSTLWKLPFPSSGSSGACFRELNGRECAVEFPNELDEGRDNHLGIVFTGVEAYKCTYLHAITPVSEAYDTLIDFGESEWLDSIRKQMKTHGDDTSELRYFMITFDDGPCYEFICKSFRIDDRTAKDDNTNARNKRRVIPEPHEPAASFTRRNSSDFTPVRGEMSIAHDTQLTRSPFGGWNSS